VKHKFRNHMVSKETKILILGTFHPDIATDADFFYGRPRNYLWRILPGCFKQPDLKNSELNKKLSFMKNYHIDFMDLICCLDIPEEGDMFNYNDSFIDRYINKYNDLTHIISELQNLTAVYFTRITFNNIPNIKNEILLIQKYCSKEKIRFDFLHTPSRHGNQKKINSWVNVIINKSNDK